MIFAAIPLIGTIGAIDDVGKPAGRVVVVVLVVVEVVVVTGAEVVEGTVVETIVESLAPESRDKESDAGRDQKENPTNSENL